MVTRNEPRWLPVRPGKITQSMLEEYDRLTGVAAQRQALRLKLMEQLDAGAAVEAGPLTVFIDEQESRPLTYAKLVPLLGEAQIAVLKEQVEPTVSRRLIVQPVLGEEEDA